MEAFEMWRERRMQWHLDNGISQDRLRWHEHEKLAHYADAAVDIQYEFPSGWKEVEGIHSRTDFDLKAHQEHSGRKLEYFDPATNERYIPYVVETAAGLDRTILALLCEAYTEEEVNGEQRTVMCFHPSIAPIKVAVLPLVKKEDDTFDVLEMLENARELSQKLDHEPTAEEIATKLDKPVGDVSKMLRLNERVSSVDTPIGGDGEKALLDIIPDINNSDPEVSTQDSDIKNSLIFWLDELNPKQKEVLARRFGLLGYEPSTLEEVGREISLTRERVRQIQVEGLRRLREILIKQGLNMENLFNVEND